MTRDPCNGDFAYANGSPVVAESFNVILWYHAALGRKYDSSKRAMTMPKGETCNELEERKFPASYVHREFTEV
jgi:hypothetical protein